MKKYNTIVYIGRFQPLHNAHVEILKKAHELADTVVVVVGSADQPRTYKNPFTQFERIEMIRSAWKNIAYSENLVVVSVQDRPYNDLAWIASIQEAVEPWIEENDRVGYIGHKKDETSFHLSMFPQWEFINFPMTNPLNATDIRAAYFGKWDSETGISASVPTSTLGFLLKFEGSREYWDIVEEKQFLDNYRLWSQGLKYPPVFVTADSVVIQSGHVLMVKRGAQPGKGLLALPGGFLNVKTDRSMLDAAVRELYEETKLKVAEKVLRGSLVDSRVFDAIDRSQRGRTITHAFKFVLADGYDLPKVKGSDDAAWSGFMPIASVKRNQCFEDHHDIISWAKGD